jgi:hypothetical protein
MPFSYRCSLLLACLTCGFILGCESDSAETSATSDTSVNVDSGADSGGGMVNADDAVTGDNDGLPGTPDATQADSIADEDGGGEAQQPADEPFSFFVTSIEGMRELSGSNDGFGGDLGGLEGADEICRQLAAKVDAGHKSWRAFLSITAGPDGEPIHAVQRIGEGPWYDRNGRLVAANLEDLMQERPVGDPQVVDDLPNEYGQGQKQYGDNHDTLTGSNSEGMLNSADPASTCMDWTSSVGPGSEKLVMGGHSWPREEGAGPGGGGGGGSQIAPPPWIQACAGLAVGDSCSVTKGKNKFDGLCQEHPDDASVVLCMEPGNDQIPVPGGGGGGGNDGVAWIDAHTVPGCAPGVQLEQVGGGEGTDTVGGGGGYGGIYCFALEP